MTAKIVALSLFKKGWAVSGGENCNVPEILGLYLNIALIRFAKKRRVGGERGGKLQRFGNFWGYKSTVYNLRNQSSEAPSVTLQPTRENKKRLP